MIAKTYTQPKTLADVLLIEVCSGWTKSTVTFAAGHPYEYGTVLALVADKYQPLDPAGAGAAKKAAAIAADVRDTAAGDKTGTVIARGAVVEMSGLVWPAGITDAQKAAAINDLDARGIVVRIAL